MKIVAINGSHVGKSGNTNVMVTALLKGAQEVGAQTNNIFLAEKNIEYCKACKFCWFKSPGKCVIKDDMNEILYSMKGADILILATPLYFDNISSMLKVFIDRLIVTASPYWEKDNDGECRHIRRYKTPKLIIVSNCGYPERSHFQVVSHWIRRVARNADTEVIGEIYASQGALLSTQVKELHAVISAYLKTLEKAGKEIVMDMRLSEQTKKLLEQNFIPDEIYIREAKNRSDYILKNI
ncbi:flavodoxin family protein [Clostridium sp. AWRP]|uniref:flavodoxin family protein n=1 Tax=Clostridium sp. AWRP TaxID=2212991 RepID=UPI000FDAA9A7|nr:flavodoxin family protein [Clostridium sp. AWRP]AZV56780.1 flavodoxin family protein [Clostridium sp. AWRP]